MYTICSIEDLEKRLKIRSERTMHPMFVAWGTTLDDSRILYMLPEEYNLVSRLTKTKPSVIKAIIGTIHIYILGLTDEHTSLALWNLVDLRQPSKEASVLCRWAYELYSDISYNFTSGLWCEALQHSIQESKQHRKVVQAIGLQIGIRMLDHDLTKTTLVQYALAYLNHWSWPQDDRLRELAAEVLFKRHLELESHHQEYRKGDVEISKLFCDTLASHLIKNPDVKEMGWNIDVTLIPSMCRAHWHVFKLQHNKVNLYEVIQKCKCPDILLQISEHKSCVIL